MILTLAWRTLRVRPWRTLFLLAGYSVGVAVMIVLLAVGDAMLAQARDERLVGGGDVSVLPEGLDLEVMKTGGVGGLYFSIPNARFVQRQLLDAPRQRGVVTAVAPQIDGKLVYLTTRDGAVIPVRASGEVPSRQRAVGAGPVLLAGAWDDDDGDRRWIAPRPDEAAHDMDHWHVAPAGPDRDTWGEWHYFNAITPDRTRWFFLTLVTAGAVPDGRWGGQVLLTLHARGRAPRRFVTAVPASAVVFDTARADLTLGRSAVTVAPDGRYVVRAEAREEGTGVRATVALTLTPASGAYFPGAAIGGDGLASGYAVPALRGVADATVCVAGACERYAGVPGYHDHNWGTWRRVEWEWGAVAAGPVGVLFGRVQRSDSLAAETPLFAYVTDSLGFAALFRPRRVSYDDARVVRVGGRRVRVPARARFADVRGADTLEVTLETEDAAATDTRRGLVERGASRADVAAIARPFFVQLVGRARVSGRVNGVAFAHEGHAFFEVYR